jgi:hypothetical protein
MMKFISRSAWIVALCLGSSFSWAQQTLNVSFGCDADSTYEIWLYDDNVLPKDWEAAQAFAASRTLRGFYGHLVTFESKAEETCVLTQAAALGLGENQQLWIGLVQANGGEPAGGWGWVTGDEISGWVPGDPVDPIGYENWAGSEPNNAGPGEDHGTIGRYGYATNPDPLVDNAGWNDENASRGTLHGMVMEYDVAALGEIVLDCDVGEECEIQIPSANPENNTITLPTGAGGSANVQIVLIQEQTACSALDVTAVREVTFKLPNEPVDKMNVPNYLCAARWILISSKLTDVDIFEGVVEAKFDPADFGLPSTGCAAENFSDPLFDPLKADLLTYLPSSKHWHVPDPSDPSSSSFPRSNNHMQDFTYAECGSSRMRTGSNQYYGVGLNYNYDPNGDVPLAFRDRTIKDLGFMQEWADDARFRNVIKQGDFQKMTQKIQGAITDIGQLEFLAARKKIVDLFNKFLDASDFKNPGPQEADEFNWHGEGIARSSHILDMLDVYLIPQ